LMRAQRAVCAASVLKQGQSEAVSFQGRLRAMPEYHWNGIVFCQVDSGLR